MKFSDYKWVSASEAWDLIVNQNCVATQDPDYDPQPQFYLSGGDVSMAYTCEDDGGFMERFTNKESFVKEFSSEQFRIVRKKE
jgi:hypothetical protein